MNIRKALTAVLLLFVAASVVARVVQEVRRGRSADDGEGEAPAEADVASPQVAVVFFHGNKRCPTCEKIEAIGHRVVHRRFAQAVEEGRLAWRVRNYEAPANAPLVDRYQVYTSTLVLLAMDDGEVTEWTNLEQMCWEKAKDEEALARRLEAELRAYLEKGS
ncbi:MAG: nitrophenyl compound nitroreductase subunit ArsF family protein [Candidatus Brocadiia bacterium]